MKKKIEIPVMFCFDTNYVIPASVAFYSLMEHADSKYNYAFYVLHSDITKEQQEKLKDTIKDFKNCNINFIDMNHRMDDLSNTIFKNVYYTKEVMYKLVVASLFPNIDKMIVSDVDVVFLGDISKSYFELTDEDDAYIAGVKPIGKILNIYDIEYAEKWTKDEIKKMSNICGGYLVMNLKKIRQDNYEKVFLDSLKKNKDRMIQMEQDIFNITCYNKIKYLGLEYVACSYMWQYYKTDDDKKTDVNYTKKQIDYAMNNPIQLHYATHIKPWKNVDCDLSYIWFKYIVKTPFLEEFLCELPNKIVIPENRINYIVNEQESLYRRISNKIPYSFRYIVKHPSTVFTKEFAKRIKRKISKKDYSYIIFDDVFPSELSPFRYVEFMEYALDNYNTYFATTGTSLPALNENRNLQEVINEAEICNPYFKNRIFDISDTNRKGSLEKIKQIKNPIAVFVFVQNMINDLYDNLQFLEENNIPFIISLYPGGGLKINDKIIDERLKRIFNSKCFRKAIVTQDNVKDYLLSNGFCTEKDIEFIFGIVTPEKTLKNAAKIRDYYSKDKDLNICFSAHKYSPKGEDKGYDLFIKSAKKIIKENKIKNIKFHVIGGFNKNDIDVTEIKDKIIFHGIKSMNELDTLYREMDIIVSPTRPYILSKGSFDGFPTGATTNAMLNGVVAIVTDELKLNNNRFVDGEDIIVVKPNVNEIVNNIYTLYSDVDRFNAIAKSGRKKAKKIYSSEYQIKNRLKLINEIAKKEYK